MRETILHPFYVLEVNKWIDIPIEADEEDMWIHPQVKLDEKTLDENDIPQTLHIISLWKGRLIVAEYENGEIVQEKHYPHILWTLGDIE